jgi:periplasmic divalent cation tolerance protein
MTEQDHPLADEAADDAGSTVEDHRMIVIYSVYGDPVCAKATASALLEADLIACANMFPKMHVLYRWEGRVVDDQGMGVLFKTRAGLEDRVRQQIRDLHEDEVPVILTLNVVEVNADYLSWLVAETGG